jgi:hypothetical protein
LITRVTTAAELARGLLIRARCICVDRIDGLVERVTATADPL